MADRIPTNRVLRGQQLGRAVAGQVVRGAGIRLSTAGRSEEVRAVLGEQSALRAADQLVTVLGSMKGAAMKLGQLLSMMDVDLFPESHREHFRSRLAVLCDRAPEVPFEQMRTVLETELGRIGRVFREFDEAPLAAASIGQVYRARLRDGRAVAVKVQYPGVAAAVRADLENLTLFARFWRNVVPVLADSAVLSEITLAIRGELDYAAEARAQRHMARRYRTHPFITVPDIVPVLCTPRVLVTELIDGTPFETARERSEAERAHIAELVYRFYIGSLYFDREYCGDPHPGNVLLAADGKVAFIDFGLFHRMQPAMVDFELDCIRAAIEGRAADLRELLVGHRIIEADSEVSAEACLDYICATAVWSLADTEITVTPALATAGFASAVDPRFDSAVKRLDNLPAEHLFSRRAELMTFGTLGKIRPTANWHRIAREWIYGEPPATDIGERIAQWREHGSGTRTA